MIKIKAIPISYVLLTIFCICYYMLLLTKGEVLSLFSMKGMLAFSGSLVSTLLFWFISGTFFSFGRRSYCISFVIYIAFYHLLGAYKINSKTPFDFSVMMENAGEAFGKESLNMIFDSLNLPVLSVGILLIVVILSIPVLRKSIMNEYGRSLWRYAAGIAMIPVYLLLISGHFTPYDNFGSVLCTVYDYFDGQETVENMDTDSYPFIKTEKIPPADKNTKKHSPIFILEIESFSAKVVEATTTEGHPYTPYFNEKIKEGFYVERFYANSIQSSKGQFATLFSLIPSFKKKEFVKYGNVRFQSLPQVLKDNGYSTFFVKAFRDINFDNTGTFVHKNGIENAISIVPYLKPEDEKQIWGWGVEDGIFYKRAFEYLDTQANVVSGKNPPFVFLHTVMNHMRFNKVPEEKQMLFPKAKKLPEQYANSIRLTDAQLHFFFEELSKRDYLKDAIVIITGDHSYPLNEHGYQFNETAWYEEFFRTPFLIIAPDIVKPERIKDIAFSQMDIAPTILDMVGIQPERHHFRGVSMFAGLPQQPVYLIQPYNGTFIGVIDKGRYKYVHRLRNNQEYFYDLKKDPREKHNLIKKADPDYLKRLRGMLHVIYLNQQLIEKDRIWKP